MRTCLCVCVCWGKCCEFVQHFSCFNMLSTFFQQTLFSQPLCSIFQHLSNFFLTFNSCSNIFSTNHRYFSNIFSTCFQQPTFFSTGPWGTLGRLGRAQGGTWTPIVANRRPSNINVLHYEWPHCGFRRTLWAPSARIVSTKAGPRKASSRRQKGRPRQRQDDDGSPQEPTEPPQGA